ncbi:MAG: hypothetical protein KDM63_16210, partial [Verrucomicrobiae bacterium]|nr:hypothetical protein [Verrucomicrobiae bacterium]
MKKLAAVFAVAVLGPSLVLAWLATRSLRNQEIVVHSQRALLHQGSSDALVSDLNTFLVDVRVFYGRLLEELLSEIGPEELSGNFDAIMRSRWSQAAVGAAVTEDGQWLNPSVTSTDPKIRRFIRDTQPFLLNEAPSEVYVAPATTGNVVVVREMAERDWISSFRRPAKPLTPVASTESEQSPSSNLAETAEMRKKEDLAMASSAPAAAPAPAPLEKQEAKLVAQQKVAVDEDRYRNRSVQSRRPQEGVSEFAVNEVVQPQPTTAPSAAPAAQAGRLATTPTDNNLARARNVRPLGQLEELQGDAQIGRFAEAANIALADNPNRQAWSTLAVNTGQLREVITDGPEGAISRFVSEGLQILLWRRDPAAPGLVFWVQLDLEEVKRDLTEIIRETGQRMGPSE